MPYLVIIIQCYLYRGSKDEFFIDDADLDELTAVTISHDGSGTSPAWHLDHIQVIPVSNSRPSSPAAYSTSSSSPQWPAEGGGQQYPGRRVSASSPQCSMRVSLGAVQQQLRKSGSGRGGSAAPFSQSRAGLNGAAYLFPCGAWLDETLGGGLTKRRLPVARWVDCRCAPCCATFQAARGLQFSKVPSGHRGSRMQVHLQLFTVTTSALTCCAWHATAGTVANQPCCYIGNSANCNATHDAGVICASLPTCAFATTAAWTPRHGTLCTSAPPTCEGLGQMQMCTSHSLAPVAAAAPSHCRANRSSTSGASGTSSGTLRCAAGRGA
jgi:hypothetical protein